jgi:protein-tyrosine phosphatase
MSSVDLHFHLLPAVDDGPCDMDESVALARAALADGSSTVIATPHVRTDFVTDVLGLPDRLHAVRAALVAAKVPLEVRCGGELGHDLVGRLDQRELDTIAQGPPGARWLLVETPFEGFTPDFHAATDELRDRGFGVVIAHPERTADAEGEGAEALRREIAAGALAQVNAMSLTGNHGTEAYDAAHALVRNGLIAVVASDAHGAARPPSLGAAWAALIDGGASPQAAWGLVRQQPWLLLARGLRSRTAAAA